MDIASKCKQNNLRRRAVKKVNYLFDSLGCVQDSEEELGLHSDHLSTRHASDSEEPCAESSSEVDSDDNQSDDGNLVSDDLVASLAGWAVNFGISLIALSALLTILRVHLPFLPKDGRTLLRTKTSYKTQMIAGGDFHYFGILNSLKTAFENMWSKVPDQHIFRLQLNFDGIPLFNSNSVQFWPILGILQDCKVKRPFVIGLFCGSSKPKSLNEYLKDLVSELKTLSCGFGIKGKWFFLKVSSVVCDAPARAFIKAIKSHTGHSACGKCTQTGLYLKHRMTFPEMNAPLRTNLSFRQMIDEDHHVAKSPLIETNIDMVGGFPHDYMHLVCLGMMRRLLDLWLSSGPLRVRLSSRLSQVISDSLVGLRFYIPSDFARKPRPLTHRLRWKATELRQFLLYTGPVVLCNVLAPPVYSHFMLLSVSVYILLSQKFCFLLNDFAHTCLVSFVEHFGVLYGQEFLCYNVHGLLHLCEDVKQHGNLDEFSAFPFENFLGTLKKLVRRPSNPLAQVIRRLSEINAQSNARDETINRTLRREHNNGPVPLIFSKAVNQFQEAFLGGLVIKITEGDNCVKIQNSIATVVNIILSEGKVFFVYKEYKHRSSFFDYPMNSSDLGIFVVRELSEDVHISEFDGSIEKYVRLPLRENFVVFPLLHSAQVHETEN